MEDNLVDKISQLSEEDLVFYKKLIKFFEFLGISSEDLANFVNLAKNLPELISKINAVLNDQKFINEQFMKLSKKGIDIDQNSNPLDEFNKERQRLNIYGK